MKKKYIIFLTIALLIIIGILFVILSRPALAPKNNLSNMNASSLVKVENKKTDNVSELNKKYYFSDPLSRAKERITKKTFGIYIDPESSPVQPERFSGYHTGVDFEVFREELNTNVSIKAVCSGELIQKRNISGYGGVAIQSCELDSESITVIYGHLKLSSIPWESGQEIKAGDTIAILGKAHSSETDGERKHLHLGFHKGADINVRGYVTSQNELLDWIDPCEYICD